MNKDFLVFDNVLNIPPPSPIHSPMRSPRLFLILLLLLSLLLIMAACNAPEVQQKQPDPLEPYYPAFHKEALPADFDFESTPRYNLMLSVDPDARRVTGVQQVHFRNLSGIVMRDIYLRLYPNLPQLGGLMKVSAVRTLPDRYAVGFVPDVENTAVRVTLINELEPGQEQDLEVEFDIIAPQKDGYVLFGDSQDILTLPYAYPMLARQTGDPAKPWRLEIPPTFADIAITDQAFYSVTVSLPADYTIVTAGVEVARADGSEPGWVDHRFVTGPAREWTMVVSNRLEKLSQTVEGDVINNYYLPQDEYAGKSAMAYSAAVMRVYHRLFSPYAYTELDVTEAPTRYLGMEFPKLNYIGVDVYRDVTNSQEILIAHEISHQWWYALVGSDPYRYPWLDEGLAEHSSLLYMETLYGKDVADRMRIQRWKIPVKWVQDNGYDVPVGQEVTAFDSTNYEILVYAKSALFFDSLYQEMGRDRYLDVLHAFIERYRFKTPTPQNFLDIVTEVGGIDPMPLYEKWIEGTEPVSEE